MARQKCKLRILVSLVTVVAGLIVTCPVRVTAFELYSGDGATVRWDNTLKYSAMFRVEKQNDALLANINGDDGNRNFDRGLISNRFDVLSELDATYKSFGLRVSGAAWYDSVYNRKNDNDSPARANSFSADHDEFTDETRKLHGRKAELLDSFVFGGGSLGSVRVNARAGRYTLLWGESLFFAGNGISWGQAPIDAVKAASLPGAQAKEVFMPVWQVSASVQPLDRLSFEGFYQLKWRKTRIPAAGSYFSTTDVLDDGGERLFTGPPGQAFFRGDDLEGKDSGQWGVATKFKVPGMNVDWGLYYYQYNERTPQVYLFPGLRADPTIGKSGEYALVFPEDVKVIGASFSTNVGDANVAGEFSVRRNMPLVSNPGVVTTGVVADNNEHALYAVGNTAHANLSGIYVMRPSPLWDQLSIAGEVGWQRVTSVTDNEKNLAAGRTRDAWGFRFSFTPTYLQVLPDLDLDVPFGVGYNPRGRSRIDPSAFAGGADEGGDLSLGLTATYRKVWITGLKYTNFFGDYHFQKKQDRDFISYNLQRTF